MNIKIQQFLFGKSHSWAQVGQNIARQLLKQNHHIDLVSTDGINPKYLPSDLAPFIKDKPQGEYHAELSYTAMHNFPFYLNHGKKNRFGIYNFDGTILPEGWAKYYKFTDKMLPSSNFAKQIFVENGIPQEHLIVVPHGIDLERFNTNVRFPLKTKKSIKVLNVFNQCHYRKNIKGILNTWGKAFNNKDDVCLVLKVLDKKPESAFEFSFKEVFGEFKRKYPKHAEVEIIYDYIEKIEPLYLACDIHFSMSNIECFHFPSLISIGTNKITIASNWGGNTDFMNKGNSLLIEGKETRCPKNYQYWTQNVKNRMFEPSVDDAVDKLRYAVNNYSELLGKFEIGMKEVREKYTWENVVKQIIGLMEK